MKMSTFANSVYHLTCKIPKGKVSTYKEIAKALGKPGASQAVGTALSKNPYPYVSNKSDPELDSNSDSEDRIPCHRVIASDGSIGGFFGKSKLIQKKMDILATEGVVFDPKTLRLSGDYKKIMFFFEHDGSG